MATGVAVMVGVPAALAWLYFVGFSPTWRADVARALGGTAFSVEIGRLTFDPFHGIVAERVTFARQVEPDRRLATVDRLLVSPNLASLLRGRVAVDRLKLENAAVEFPFVDDGSKPDAIALTNIQAELVSGAGTVTINRAECRIEGIHVSVRGQLLMPTESPVAKPQTPEHAASRAAVIRSVLAITDRLRFAEPGPSLDVTLSGDLSAPETIRADPVTLRTGGVQFDGLRFDRLALDASYADRVLRVTNLSAAGDSGTLQAAGAWSFPENRGHLDLTGGLRVAPLLHLAGKGDVARQVSIDATPEIEASVRVSLAQGKPDIAVVGRAEVGAFRARNIQGRRFATNFAWRNGRLFLQDAEVVSATGTVRARLLAGPGEFRLALDSDADPTEFLEIFGPKERVIIELLSFKDPPKLSIELNGTRPSLDALAGEGRVKLGRSAMRGSWIDSGAADVVVKDRAILYRNLVIEKGRQRATGAFTYDFGRREVRLDGIRSNLNPPDVLMWVDPRIAETVAVYRFQGPPEVRADGLTHMQDPSKNDLRISVDAPAGLAYELLNKDLVFGDVAAKIHLKGRKVLADVSRATLYGGQVALDADVSIAPDDPTFGVDVTLDRVDFPSLTKLYFGYERSKGLMSGGYSFRASLREPAKMRGSGSIRIEDGHVLAIPLFGPLSEVISAILPGVGHESARLASADFTVSDQRIATKNLEIQGDGFELLGDGDVGFPGGDLNLAVRINARGIPGLVFFPVSKLLEYVSTGTVSDPQWRPKIIPREFWQVLGLGPATPTRPEPETPPSPPSKPRLGPGIRR